MADVIHDAVEAAWQDGFEAGKRQNQDAVDEAWNSGYDAGWTDGYDNGSYGSQEQS